MELSRKPSGNNQESQQVKRLASLNVRGGVNQVKSKEEQQLERKEEGYDERRAEEFYESGGTESFAGDHKPFGGDQRSFGGDLKSFGGDPTEVISDVIPGVPTVSLSVVSKETLTKLHNHLCT